MSRDRPILEPCPCCGGPGQIKDSNGRSVRQGWVGCPECGLYIQWKISPEGAVRVWNTRTWPDPGKQGNVTRSSRVAMGIRPRTGDGDGGGT